MEVGAAAAAAAAGSAGMGLFSYNRGNYMMDQKSHYGRFTAGLNMAIAQTGMYRQDIADLTSLTVTRQDCYHGIAAMGLTILTAIYCPGRLGFHTVPPPGWLMGLEFVNIAGCYLFLGLTLWLAMHASMRADTAATHMLTRFVRLPIPSQGMLDKARKFLASFEEQPLKEVFRVPFTRHQTASSKNEGGFNEDMEIDGAALKRSRHGYDVPAWYRKEKAVDNVNTIDTVESMMPLAGRGTAPEHFEAYREMQMEWFPYDVYARVSIFLAFMHLTHCWCYLQIGHQLMENRALAACAIVVLPMFVLQQIILTLDIIPNGFAIHRLGPCALWFAYIAAAIEYKRWYSPGAQVFGFALVYCAYGIHIVYTLQLLRLCAPAEEAPVVAETPGASWWPSEWRLPSAFQHAIWLVAPPKQLEAGQCDIAGELRAMQRDVGAAGGAAKDGASDADRRADVHRALGKQGESPAWGNVRIGLYSLVVAWVFLTFGFTYEVLNQNTTHPSLLMAPGLPQHSRDPRYRPAKPGHHEPTEVGTGGVLAGPAKSIHADAVHRRLSEIDLSSGLAAHEDIASRLRDLMPYLRQLAFPSAGQLPRLAAPHDSPAVSAAKAPVRAAVQWPPLFEPRLLVCSASSNAALALSRHGRGVVLDMPVGTPEHILPEATPFVLEGAAAHGTLVAASWDAAGLLLLAESGATLECPGGGPVDGRWRCGPLLGARLPISLGGKPFAGSVAISRTGTAAEAQGLRAAIVFPGEAAVAMFSRAGGRPAAPWLPSGEVRTAGPTTAASFTAAGEALLLAAADGALAQVQLDDGASLAAAPAVAGYQGHAWSAACQISSGPIARLAVAAPGGEQFEEPKVLLG